MTEQAKSDGPATLTMTIGDRAYTFRLDLNAMCAIEAEASGSGPDITFPQVLARVSRNDFRAVRLLVWGALQGAHPDVTVERAGALIDAAGGIAKFSEQLTALALPGRSKGKKRGRAA